jgi:predicted metal-dependent hydrolase
MCPEDLQRGITFFNSGEFLKCHDYFEELIPHAAGQDADFLHGLIELAAACYHLKQGNVFGARYLLTSAFDLISPSQPSYQGFDIAGLMEQIAQCRALTEALDDDEDIGFDEAHLPRIERHRPPERP